MPFTTGPIENTGSQPSSANSVRVKILNRRTAGTISGVVRTFRLNGTRRLIDERTFSVAPNASALRVLSLIHSTLGRAEQYEVEIVPNQAGGLYSVWGIAAGGVIITSQRVLHSELTEF
ncbi:hypothetical protein J2S09_000538 [Bacillus fengqiuensis]|nr:hypothetical protein [Bacillus fengqiuensis]